MVDTSTIHPPKTLEEARAIRYGVWDGEPEGYPFNERRCAYPVIQFNYPHIYRQCLKRNGHGVGELYCKQHSRMV